MRCPRGWEVRAVDEGRLGPSDVAAFERHARACASCLKEVTELRELRTLTRELAGAQPHPGELEIRRLRARVLRDVMSAPSHRPRALVGVLALAVSAAAAVLVVVPRLGRLHPAPAPVAAVEPFAAVITPAPEAAWTQARERHVERVVLTDGDVTLQVRKQAEDERFVVTVPDGEIEVRGTTFEVAVHDGRTARVHVDTGVVVVRVHGESVLAAGETWSPPALEKPEARSDVPLPPSAPRIARPSAVPTLRPAAAPASTASPPREAAIVGKVATDAVDGEMAEYQRAIDAYRLGRYDQAAEMLRAFSAAHPASPLLDDATFIEATTEASAGHAEAAARLAEGHMRRFPESFHRKDAAILVARFRRDHGDCVGARTALAPWLGGPRQDPGAASALGHCADAQ